MKKNISTLLILYFGLLASVYSQQEFPNPKILLNEMSEASRNLNYDGVFVYRQGKQIDTMRIIHKSGEDGIYERLVSLTGHAREVIRDGEKVKCYFPENKAVVVDNSRVGKLISSYLPSPIQSISEFYDFQIVGQDRIAGKDAWIINVKPNDKYRYGYQLWIDKESKLLLKSELKNQIGVTLEQIMFAQLDILDHIDDALLQPSVNADDYTWHNNLKTHEASTTPETIQWRATWMPTGFSMSEYAKQSMVTSETPVEHMVYTDGLAMVSIFIEKIQNQPDLDAGASKIGGVNTYAVHADGYQVTAVGEVPKATVKQMADSVKSLQ